MKKLFLLFLALTFTQLVFSQIKNINSLVHKVKKANRDAEKHDLMIPGWLVRFGANFVDTDDLDGINIKMLGIRR